MKSVRRLRSLRLAGLLAALCLFEMPVWGQGAARPPAQATPVTETAPGGATKPAAAPGDEPALPTVDLLFQDRPPYYASQPGRQPPQGLVIEPLRRGLERAQLPHRWVLTPAVRQLLMVENGAHLICAVGWFRNPEREAKGQFSVPLYRGQPLAMLARRDAPLNEGMSQREAMASPARLLVKQGYSYGPELDALIATRHGRVEQGSGEVGQLLRMLMVGNADWMAVAPEEVEAQFQADPSRSRVLHVLRFSDAPVPQARHLYCNKAVPAAWLERLAAALR